jgi:hypothetical protein
MAGAPQRRDQDAEEGRFLTLNFTVSVARGLDVVKDSSFTELGGVRVKVEMYGKPKGPLQCTVNAASASGTRS